MFALLISASAYANNNANIQGVAFGTNYETVITGGIKDYRHTLIGQQTPIVYKHDVQAWSSTRLHSTSKPTALATPISRGAFYLDNQTKRTRWKTWRSLQPNNGYDYPGVTIDWEDDDMPYKGGLSPIENNYLFTVRIYPSAMPTPRCCAADHRHNVRNWYTRAIGN